MTDRHNTCTNPALTNDATGWAGDSTPTRTDVTGEGFSRQWAARYTSATVLRTSSGAVTAGLTYTLSAYMRAPNNGSGTAYIAWVNGSGGDISYTTASYSITGGTVTRVSVTGTAPSGAVKANMLTDGINFAFNTVDITEMLIEQTGTLDTYFDGDSPNATWDGTAGNSSSTLSSVVNVSDSDSGSGSDTAALTAALAATDAGAAADVATLNATLGATDTAAGTETASLTVLITDSDTATGADSASLAAALSSTDAASAAESVLVGLSASDTAVATDSGTVTAAHTAADAAAAADAAVVTASLAASDTGHGSEQARAIVPGRVITATTGARRWSAYLPPQP